VKPPLEPQLPPAEALVPLDELPSDENTEIFLLVFRLWQAGQDGVWSASEKRTIFSNSPPQSLH
jgi:hypothetical protein